MQKIPTTISDVAIIGAGPYGLSIAAHLSAMGADFRIFGSPMETWKTSMPTGMYLKSEGFASSLSDPNGAFPLRTFCAEQGLSYADLGRPVERSVFVAYGQAFQRRFAPQLEQEQVTALTAAPYGFDLKLASGTMAAARRVVIAAGIRSFDHVPDELRALDPAHLSHSAAFGDAAHLAGRSVAVVGSGASATDVAADLLANGATVTIIARKPSIKFPTALGERNLVQRIKSPMTGLGPGWKSVLCVRAPLLFHAMPPGFRVDVVRRYLGPAPAWFVREQVEGNVAVLPQSEIVGARSVGGRANLELRRTDGTIGQIYADHVVAATGYRVNIERLRFLEPSIKQNLRQLVGAPVLSRNFESTQRGLFFVGAAAANSFGPLLRFVYGADFAARRISRYLMGSSKGRRSIPAVGTAAAAEMTPH